MMQPRHITLSELQSQIRESLIERFALPVWIVAEISELKVNYSGHCYMELTEKGERDGLAKAAAKGVIWRSHYPCIASYFLATTGQQLAAGLKVLIKVTVNYHELYGLSLQVSDIDATYTLGEMERQRQATIERLKQEGVWDMNRAQVLPRVVQRVAVISSKNAAGYQDFINELRRSGYHFLLTLHNAVMQGDDAEDSIISALYDIVERQEEYDAVVIIRGGGSTSDLNCFNSYKLSSHIAQLPLPVISGIGHDKDVSVVDMVSHTSLKTPTAVAGWLVERMLEFETWLDSVALTLYDLSVELSRKELLRLERHQTELRSRSERLLERESMNLTTLFEELTTASKSALKSEEMRLQRAEELCESNSPKRILKLGFSIVRHNGAAQTSADSLKQGDRVEIELSTGSVKATID